MRVLGGTLVYQPPSNSRTLSDTVRSIDESTISRRTFGLLGLAFYLLSFK